MYPFLLHAYAELVPHDSAEFDRILVLLESYLMRRMICGLTTKNYNRYFIDMMRSLDRDGAVSAKNVAEYMGRSNAESTLYPDDHALEAAVIDLPIYGRLAQYKLRAILEALDFYAENTKSEVLPLPAGLTIEHVMPRSWAANWPLPDKVTSDPVTKLKAEQRRERLINSLGNLTLVTGKLNPALSNSSWSQKRPELLKFSKLNLTKYFHGAEAVVWDEGAIEKRTLHLAKHLAAIWPALPVTPAQPAA